MVRGGGGGSKWVGVVVGYTPYEGSNLASQMSRKLEVFDRKLEGSHSLFCTYFDKYWRRRIISIKLRFSSFIESTRCHIHN